MLQENYLNISDTKAIQAFHATARLKGIRIRYFALERSGKQVTIRQKLKGN